MLRINRLFYQNDAYGFLDEEIKTFFPERGRLVPDIPRLKPDTELWVDFVIDLAPNAKVLAQRKALRGYVRATMRGYKAKNGSVRLDYATKHYGDGNRWVLRTSKTPRVFELDESYEGLLNALARLPMFAW